MFNRRQAVKTMLALGVAGSPAIAKAAKEKPPCGLKELPLRIVKFGKIGRIANYAELMEGVAFIEVENPHCKTFTRRQTVFVSQADAISRSDFGGGRGSVVWGKMLLVEHIYENLNPSLHYTLDQTDDSNFGGHDSCVCYGSLATEYIAQAKQQLKKA